MFSGMQAQRLMNFWEDLVVRAGRRWFRGGVMLLLLGFFGMDYFTFSLYEYRRYCLVGSWLLALSARM